MVHCEGNPPVARGFPHRGIRLTKYQLYRKRFLVMMLSESSQGSHLCSFAQADFTHIIQGTLVLHVCPGAIDATRQDMARAISWITSLEVKHSSAKPCAYIPGYIYLLDYGDIIWGLRGIQWTATQLFVQRLNQTNSTGINAAAIGGFP